MFFFFFKRKTAYEMRISDWSSDVCSSDLGSSGDDPDGFAAITGPSTPGFPDTPSMGGMSSPQRVTLPRPSLAIRALGNMSYGATASDIAAFNADRKSTRLNSSH